MEIKDVVLVEMSDAIRRPPKAKPCCRVCFEVETFQKLFVVEDLECECSLYLHDICVKEWFRIAGREICPQCGQEWRVVDSCLRYESICSRCALCWIILILVIFVSIALYQMITQIYMRS